MRKLRVLGGLNPERVFYYFEEISGIPRGSYNVKAVSDYCVGVAKSLGLEVRQDEAFNVIIKKPASEGYGPSPALMIQGHLDMVCVHDADYPIDMEKEPIKLIVEDGFVRADHTTLGGDDGIAVAMGLAILEDETLEHPDLEVVFTTEEEVGMDGVIALDVSDLKASYLLNLAKSPAYHNHIQPCILRSFEVHFRVSYIYSFSFINVKCFYYRINTIRIWFDPLAFFISYGHIEKTVEKIMTQAFHCIFRLVRYNSSKHSCFSESSE